MNRSILYEVQHLTFAGTGITTYAKGLVRAARNIGYDVDGLWGVDKALDRHDDALNELLAFDAPPQKALGDLWGDGLRALGFARPHQLRRGGLVTGPATAPFEVFRNIFVATRLLEGSRAHFGIFNRLVSLQLAAPPSIFHATFPVPLRVKGASNVYTIHDLVPLRLPYATLDNKKFTYRLLKKLAETADHIITVSEHSRRDIIDVLKVDEHRVTNTYQAVTFPEDLLNRKDDQVADDIRRNFELEADRYFLFYGAIEPKKNIVRLIDGYLASGAKHPLIIAGAAGWQNSEELARLEDEQFSTYELTDGVIKRRPRLRRVGYLSQDLLASLIRGARAVLLPSIYEGFGLPVAEAMMLGTPVITSNVSSLPEVAGDAAMLVNPHETAEIANAIRAIDQDEGLRRGLIARGRVQAAKFSQTAYEQRLAQAYKAV
jgi:glycosyltransferase involved in cell wall biosynthesis